jgi:TatD DNase family protein
MENGIIPFIDIHTHNINGAGNTITVLNVFPTNTLPNHVYLSCGIHPWYTDGCEIQMQLLSEAATNNRVIAIGECGLDKKIATPLKIQENIFCRQVELSENTKKPLIIHCVKAFNELFHIHKNMKPAMPWILHGFNPNIEIANRCLELGMKLSFGKSLVKENIKVVNTLQNIPVSAVFLETDESEITIAEIYSHYSAIKGMPLDTLKAAMMDNFKECFNLKILTPNQLKNVS